MDTLEAMRQMLDDAGTTPYEAAARLGKSRTYVSNLFVRGSIPSAERLAAIAGACGHRLAIVPVAADLPEGSIIIDPKPDSSGGVDQS